MNKQEEPESFAELEMSYTIIWDKLLATLKDYVTNGGDIDAQVVRSIIQRASLSAAQISDGFNLSLKGKELQETLRYANNVKQYSTVANLFRAMALMLRYEVELNNDYSQFKPVYGFEATGRIPGDEVMFGSNSAI